MTPGLQLGVPRRDARLRGHAYPVKRAWQEDVRARLAALGITPKELAQKIGCAQSSLHDALSKPNAKHSVLVPAIHAALGWDPPPDPQSPPLPSPDAIEMAHLYDRLPEEARRKLREDAEFYIRMTGLTEKV